MCELPEVFRPGQISEFDKEPCEKYVSRMGIELPLWPACVLEQWLYSNDRSPNYKFSEDVFRQMQFTAKTLALDELPDCDCMRWPGFEEIANNGYGDDDAHAAKEAARHWPRQSYSRDDLSDFIYLQGTWPIPIILADNSNGDKHFLDGEPLKAPIHLLEGHHRLAWLLAMRNQGRANTHHQVWLARW